MFAQFLHINVSRHGTITSFKEYHGLEKSLFQDHTIFFCYTISAVYSVFTGARLRLRAVGESHLCV